MVFSKVCPSIALYRESMSMMMYSISKTIRLGAFLSVMCTEIVPMIGVSNPMNLIKDYEVLLSYFSSIFICLKILRKMILLELLYQRGFSLVMTMASS